MTWEHHAEGMTGFRIQAGLDEANGEKESRIDADPMGLTDHDPDQFRVRADALRETGVGEDDSQRDEKLVEHQGDRMDLHHHLHPFEVCST